jgi:hypothetical protein
VFGKSLRTSQWFKYASGVEAGAEVAEHPLMRLLVDHQVEGVEEVAQESVISYALLVCLAVLWLLLVLALLAAHQ